MTWNILRCPGKETLNLEEALVDLGFEAWAPREWKNKRVPRKKIRMTVQKPVLPSYVFLAEGQGQQAIRAIGMSIPFAIMVLLGEQVVIREEELEGLRVYDRRDPPRFQPRKYRAALTDSTVPSVKADPKIKTYQVGDRVRLKTGTMLEGVMGVITGKGTGTEITIAVENSAARIQLSSFLVDPVAV